MAHFAKLDQDNIVIKVNVVHNNELLVDGTENEQKGINFLNTLFNTSDNWKQTSYNTSGGVHKLGGTPLRKNYAGIGFTYDGDKDAFIPPQPFSSWTLNEDTCRWEPPVAYPDDDKIYIWNEETTNWVEGT
tara:strand:- start:42 stop:434 length:393 start_codon:yes stop_codon:yes gene_type:complete